MLFKRSNEKKLKMIWSAEKNDTTSYFVGTAHFFAYSFRTSLLALMRGARLVLFEGPLDRENMAKVVKAGTVGRDAPNVFDTVGRSTVTAINSALAPSCRQGRKMAMLDLFTPRDQTPVHAMVAGMAPWLAFFTIFSQFVEKKGWTNSVDLEAYRIAEELEKKIIWLESIDEQIAVLESLNTDQIIDFLKRIDRWDMYIRKYEKWYLAGDLEKIKANRFGFPTRHPRVIDNRDETLYRRISPHLDQGNAVICVGVPHMVGLSRMLQTDGYRVERYHPK